MSLRFLFTEPEVKNIFFNIINFFVCRLKTNCGHFEKPLTNRWCDNHLISNQSAQRIFNNRRCNYTKHHVAFTLQHIYYHSLLSTQQLQCSSFLPIYLILLVVKTKMKNIYIVYSYSVSLVIALLFINLLKDGAYYCYCAYTVRSAHLEILGFPMGSAY